MFDSFNSERDRWIELQRLGRRRYIVRNTVLLGNPLFLALGTLSHLQPWTHFLTLESRLIAVFAALAASYGTGYLCSSALWRKGIRTLHENANFQPAAQKTAP